MYISILPTWAPASFNQESKRCVAFNEKCVKDKKVATQKQSETIHTHTYTAHTPEEDPSTHTPESSRVESSWFEEEEDDEK